MDISMIICLLVFPFMVITMISMFIIAAGLNRTQMISHISKIVYKVKTLFSSNLH